MQNFPSDKISNHSSRDQIVVLSVDDDPVNQTVIEFLLEGRQKYHVVKAMDGMEALRYLESVDTLPDLILLDVMMPGLSGYEVCLKIRDLYPASIPIIMISAKCGREDIVQGLNCKCNDYVTKPFDKEELLARIETHIKLNSMRESQEMGNITNELRVMTSPETELPQGECLVVSVETVLPIEPRRSEINSIARKFGLIHVPSRLPIFHAISQSKKIFQFVKDLIDLVESESGNSAAIFVSKIDNFQANEFEGIVPVRFWSSRGLTQHFKLLSASVDINGLELPSYSRPSTVFCSPLLVDSLGFHSRSIKSRNNTCRIFFPALTSEDSADPLASKQILSPIVPISCGKFPAVNLQFSNQCCQKLNDALTMSRSRETSRDFAAEFKQILDTYDPENGPIQYESISTLLNELAAVFSSEPGPEISFIDSLIASVQDATLHKPLCDVLNGLVRNERLETRLSQRETEYSHLVKIVNKNFKTVLDLESLNEMLYLEVQRRVFEVPFGT